MKKDDFSDTGQSEKKKVQKKSSIVSWAVFLFTISIVILSLISVIFPTLIVSNNSNLSELREFGIEPFSVDPFFLGVWAEPLIVTNLIILGIAVLYIKKKLPSPIRKSIDFVFSVEVSKKVAFIVIIVLLGIYTGLSANELGVEENWEDYPEVKRKTVERSVEQAFTVFDVPIKYLFLSSSVYLFDNIRILPFVASICLLILTYLITAEISQKRFGGIVAFVILLQSHVFLTYDTTASYDNFWILFYLLSLYLVYKAWPLSPISYLLSFMSKSLSIMFFPLNLFFIFRANISKKRKFYTAAIYGTILAVVVGVGLSSNVNLIQVSQFNEDLFWQGFTSLSYQLRFDGLVLIFLLPLTIGLFLYSRSGLTQSDSILVLIAGILFTAPLLTGFTDNTNQPYRFVPLVVFFAIGVGTLLSKRLSLNGFVNL